MDTDVKIDINVGDESNVDMEAGQGTVTPSRMDCPDVKIDIPAAEASFSPRPKSEHSLLTTDEVLDRVAKYPQNVIQIPVYAFWDTEATGLLAQDDHIISLGCVLCLYSDSHGFEAFAEFHEYIQTSRRMDPVAAAVHHITPAMLRSSGHSFPEVIRAWCDWFQTSVKVMNRRVRTLMMAHNGHGFDDLILYCNMKMRMTPSECDDCKLLVTYESMLKELRVDVSIDTMKMLRHLYKDMSEDQCPKNSNKKVEFGLGTCFTFFCERPELEGAHDALVDTWALIDVMNSARVRAVVKSMHFSTSYCKAAITYFRPVAKLMAEVERGAGLKVKLSSGGEVQKVSTKLPDRPLLTMPEFGSDDPDLVQLCWTCMCYGKLIEHKCEQ